jgi:hypothetical protein
LVVIRRPAAPYFPPAESLLPSQLPDCGRDVRGAGVPRSPAPTVTAPERAHATRYATILTVCRRFALILLNISCVVQRAGDPKAALGEGPRARGRDRPPSPACVRAGVRPTRSRPLRAAAARSPAPERGWRGAPGLFRSERSRASQRAQIVGHVAELPDQRGISELAGGRIARSAERADLPLPRADGAAYAVDLLANVVELTLEPYRRPGSGIFRLDQSGGGRRISTRSRTSKSLRTCWTWQSTS